MAIGKTVLYVVYAAIVTGLTVAIVTSFDSGKSASPPAKQGSSSQQASNKPQTSSTKTTTPSSQTSSGQSSQAGNSSAQLNNTGPGDTIGLFVAISAAGTILYRRYLVLKNVS